MWALGVLGIAVALSIVHVTAMALAAHAVGARVEEVQIFLGPAMVVRKERPTIRLGALPLGMWMRCLGQLETDPQTEPGSYHALAPWRRVVVLVAGNLLLLAVAALVAGPADALASFVRAPVQLASLLVDPTHAVETLRDFVAQPIAMALVGTLAAKMAAWNLLPLHGLNGAAILRELVPRSARARFDGVLAVVSMLVVLALAIALAVAAFRV